MLVLCAYSFSQVPQMINYQGKLTKSTGAPLDTTIAMVFSIYADSGGTTLNWTETQGAVKVEKGVFNVLLGSVNPISSSVFNGSVRYLGVKVGTDSEITPRKPMVSVPYAYRAGSLQTNCHDCDSIFVNVAGPDSVYSSSGTAFLGKASGSSGSSMYGMRGYADNTSAGNAYGGLFETSSSGTGAHYGVYGLGYGSSAVFGGVFNVGSGGTGAHYGSYSVAFGNSSSSTYGVYGYGSNSSNGNVYAGNFYTSSNGTGEHYGVYTSSFGSSDSTTYGVYGYGSNSSTGNAIGGYFETSSSGTGAHFALKARGYSNYFGSPTYGVHSYAENTSSGVTIAGYFATSSSGTGQHMGIDALSAGSSGSSTYGLSSIANNSSSGDAYGGYFSAYSTSGIAYGVYAYAASPSYAGYFYGNLTATGTKSAAVKVDNGEYRLLYCQESPENWFEDFGEGQLANGKAHISLDPLFLQTVAINSQNPIKVFVQLNEPDCKGTAVIRGTTGFDVIELQNGTSNASFTYRVVAKRKGYENTRLAKMAGSTPEAIALEQAKHQAEMEKERARMEEERLKQEGERKQMSEQQLKIDKEIR